MQFQVTQSAFFAHFVLLAFLASGCTTTKTSDRNVSSITISEAEELVVGKKGVLGFGGNKSSVFVDARRVDAFRKRHIPNAINLPYEHVTRDHTQLDHYDILIVYGDEYNDVRAIGMSKRLMELGHYQVYTLQGGLRAWTDAELPIDTGE